MCCCLLWTIQLLKDNHSLYHALNNTLYISCHCDVSSSARLWAFIGLYAIYRAALLLSYCSQQSNLFLRCSYSSSLVFEFFLVPSATLGSIGSPLARRSGGRSAVFSLSEADREFCAQNYSLEFCSKLKCVVFKMYQCLPEIFFVCSSQVNFSSSISNNIRSFEWYWCWRKTDVTFLW